ncbi:MAG: SDR family oxidoreductase [Chloroflexota bacterium]|nr:SDR family oxidoreductase [Chloroflexota bacterium]
MTRPLKDQVIVITGASSGIGRATALKCAQAGAKVVLAARDQQALDEVVTQIQLNSGSAVSHVTDVSQYAEVETLANQTFASFGRIDTWVNDAAVALYGMFNETSTEEFEQVIRVNLLGTMYGVKAVLPHMQRQGYGTIINVGSVLSSRAVPLQTAYVASKFGVRGFTDALRMELMSQKADITVTLVMPASINTPFFTHARSRMGVRPQPIPPVYEVELAADTIIHAIKTRPRDAYVGGAGPLFTIMQKLSPTFVDKLMTLNDMAFKSQKTKMPDTGRDALFEPMEGSSRASGDFAHLVKPSLYSRLAQNTPLSLLIAAGIAIGGIALYKNGKDD